MKNTNYILEHYLTILPKITPLVSVCCLIFKPRDYAHLVQLLWSVSLFSSSYVCYVHIMAIYVYSTGYGQANPSNFQSLKNLKLSLKSP